MGFKPYQLQFHFKLFLCKLLPIATQPKVPRMNLGCGFSTTIVNAQTDITHLGIHKVFYGTRCANKLMVQEDLNIMMLKDMHDATEVGHVCTLQYTFVCRSAGALGPVSKTNPLHILT